MNSNELPPLWFEKISASEKYKLLGKVASGLAHDINNPIMIIQNYISLLMEDVESLSSVEIKKDDQYCEDFKEILDQCSQLANITKSLLQFSRINTPKAHNYDVITFLNNVLSLMSPIFAKHKISVYVDLPKEPIKTYLIPDEIQQVFMIILDNSVDSLNQKFQSQAPKLVQKDIKVNVEIVLCDDLIETQKYVKISFLDNGTGILPEEKSNIFAPFHTTKIKHTGGISSPKIYGTGMGLAVAQNIVENYHGKIEFESKIQEFAKFSVFLPFSTGKDAEFQDIVF